MSQAYWDTRTLFITCRHYWFLRCLQAGTRTHYRKARMNVLDLNKICLFKTIDWMVHLISITPMSDSWIMDTLGKFDWGVWYVIIFLYEQFWIRVAAVSKRGKKVRTVACHAVRSVNESRDTRNCVQKQARVCDLCHLHHSSILQSPRICFVLSDIANTPQFQSSWR